VSGVAEAQRADGSQITRGKYLVTLGGCNDCHTPGYFFGTPDMSRFLGGSDVGFEIPGQVSLWAQTSHPTKRPASVVGPQSRS
jgi:mono/diheme cytochrome c family protein